MAKRLFRIVLTLFGLVTGYLVAAQFIESLPPLPESAAAFYPWLAIIAYALFTVVAGLICFFIAHPVYDRLLRVARWFEKKLSGQPITDILFGVLGMIIACIPAYLLTPLFSGLHEILRTPLLAAMYIILIYLGVTLMSKRWHELLSAILPRLSQQRQEQSIGRSAGGALCPDKVLDTSAIIDGRVFDVIRLGFLEGDIILPHFVLTEMQGIADASDALKRRKGRSGLDALAELRKQYPARVIVDETPMDASDAVDVRLLKLTQARGGVILTTDFNLNKLAGVTGVPVLNINDLANALKSILLPGDTVTVTIAKEGKEPMQGIAYLEDGTMVVVENARNRIGETMAVVVTSALNTSAGRMFFAK